MNGVLPLTKGVTDIQFLASVYCNQVNPDNMRGVPVILITKGLGNGNHILS